MAITAQQLVSARIRATAPDPLTLEGLRSWSYYRSKPYPAYLASDSPIARWNTTTDGPYPACVPIAKYIIDTSADFLFQDPPSLYVPVSRPLSDLLEEILSSNEVYGRLRDEAVRAGNEGCTILKFAFTPENRRRPVALQWLPISDVEFFHDPMDADTVQLVRVQFKFRDSDGSWYWYREEWTEEEYTLYHRIPTDEDSDDRAVDEGRWSVIETQANPFGVIPFRKIFNLCEAGEIEGRGDLWDLWHLLDRLNLQYWYWDRSSQLDGDPIWAIINAVGEVATPSPGAVLRLNGEDAQIKAVEAQGMMAAHRKELIHHYHNWIIDAASVVRLETEKLTNKGNFTRAVLEQLHAPLIRLTNRKRTQWGTNGLEEFCEDLLFGLATCGAARVGGSFAALSEVRPEDPKTYDVRIEWGGFFALSEDERSAGLANIATAEVNGFLTREMAVRRALTYFDGIGENSALPDVVSAYPENPVVSAARDTAARKAEAKAVRAGEPDVVPQ